jgi:2-polyprenyl-3-methyl-5-hydroxy-6-metoxy-1,4-benzoquinol methylase/tetratricopeptide (TPR) repeat protein
VNRKQRRIAAKLGTQAAHFVVSGAIDPSAEVAELSRRAVRHHQAGQLAEAEICYRKVLAIEPTHFDSLHLLGVAIHQSGRSDLAVNLINQAIAVGSGGRDGKKSGSGLSIRGAKQPPGSAELAIAHSNLSIVLTALDRPIEALAAIQRSLHLAETENTKLLFVQCIRALTCVPEVLNRDYLVRALSEPWGRPINLARFVANVIKRDGTTAERIRRFAAANSEKGPRSGIIDRAELADVSSDRLLRTLLETTIVFDVDLERYLTALRSTMLAMACGGIDPGGHDREILQFFCALACQCFINEFVFMCSDQEQELAQRLRTMIAGALDAGTPVPELGLVAFAAYYPLASLSAANALARRPWSNVVAQLVTLQLREPEQERQLRASVPRLTAIGPGTSRAVAQQYEENPYPRWVKASPVGQATSISARLREQFPQLDPRTLVTPKTAEILIAGCGTGQHSIETARQFKGARLLAVDLSVTSLCYAMRKTRELGLTNIDYAQADILQLGTLGRTFDVIEASGVLHHLAEPMVGWQVLLSILRPGGFMRLGLYSKMARRNLAPARTIIEQRGYGPSPQEIRAFRQDLTRVSQNPALAKVAEWADFFSTSTCRDLLFHVQEHQLTLPEIGAFLQQNQLWFLGFILPQAARERFRQRFPDDVELTNLANWHIFETENPATFSEMYEFWIGKPA